MKSMITKILIRKAPNRFTLLGILVVILSACGTSKEIPHKSGNDNYSVKYVPSSENYYEGNIIVEVYDSNNQELTGAHVTILLDGQKISELELKTTAMGVFYKETQKIIVLVSKEGYSDVKTSNVAMSGDKACVITVRLPEK